MLLMWWYGVKWSDLSLCLEATKIRGKFVKITGQSKIHFPACTAINKKINRESDLGTHPDCNPSACVPYSLFLTIKLHTTVSSKRKSIFIANMEEKERGREGKVSLPVFVVVLLLGLLRLHTHDSNVSLALSLLPVSWHFAVPCKWMLMLSRQAGDLNKIIM